MPRFSYSATLPDGRIEQGSHTAASLEAAELALYERELRNISVTPHTGLLQKELTAPRVKREEIMNLSRQLGAFIAAGLPLIEAVRLLGAETRNSSLRRVLVDVEDGLRAGDTLSQCLDRHPRTFPEFYRGILRSAEVTGRLDSVLAQLAGYLERDLEARRKVTAALIYPAVIAGMSVLTVAVLAGYVLPQFTTFFASLNATLPLPTRMLLGVTAFLVSYWWALLGGGLLLALALFLTRRTGRGRYAMDRFLLAVPLVGDTVRFVLVERFCRLLSAMVGAGVALPEAMRVASDSLRNVVFVRALSEVGTAMLSGEGLAGPLAVTGLFPTTALQMIRVGEETGTLDDQLETTAAYYEGELGYRIGKLTALFEPVVIVVMGLVVGFVAVALVSAMYGVLDQGAL